MLVELNNPSIGIAKDSNVSTSTGQQTGGANEAKAVTANSSSSTSTNNDSNSGTLFNRKDSTPVQTMNESKPKEDFGSYSKPADYSFLLSDRVKNVNKSNPTGFIGSDSDNTIDFRIGGPKEDEDYLKGIEKECSAKSAEVERLQKEYDQLVEDNKEMVERERKELEELNKKSWLEHFFKSDEIQKKAQAIEKEANERVEVLDSMLEALNTAKNERVELLTKYEEASKEVAERAKEAERKETELSNPTVAPLVTETETKTKTAERAKEKDDNTEIPTSMESSKYFEWEQTPYGPNAKYTDPTTKEVFQQTVISGEQKTDTYTDSNGSSTSVDFVYDSSSGNSTYTVTKDGKIVGTYNNDGDAYKAANKIVGKDVWKDFADGGLMGGASEAYETYKKSKEAAKTVLDETLGVETREPTSEEMKDINEYLKSLANEDKTETRSSSFFNKWEKEFDDIMNNPNYSIEDKIREQDIKVKTYNEAAGEEIRAIVEEQVNKGVALQDIRNSEDYREYTQKYFDLGQKIYDDASKLDEEAADFDREDTLGEKIRNRTIDIIDSITLGKTKITENDAYEINKLMKSNEGVKLAATAMMKSAAFNGAQNTQGQKYSEAWKSSKASITPAEMFATFYNGASSAVGIGLSTVLFATPGLQGFGAALFAASVKNAAEAGLRSSKKDFTNYEQMFNPDNKLGIKAYNQFIESANIGDMRAASTYTTSTSGAMKICSGIAQLPINPSAAFSTIRDGVNEISKVSKGGLKGTSDQVIKNIYNFAVDFEDAMEMQGAPYSGRLVSKNDDNDDDLFTRTSDFGTVSADDENRVRADSSYSGFREQAINDNLNERFNAGMGKDVSEAVSDERVKSFIVSIYKNEPDFIKNAISKIMKSYREVI